MDAQTILVIILGAALAIFLSLAIILTVMLIKITRRVDAITDKAEGAANNLVSISHVLRRSLRPAVVASFLNRLLHKLHPTAKRATRGRKK